MPSDHDEKPVSAVVGSAARKSDLVMFDNDEGWRRKCPGCGRWYAVEELINGQCPRCSGHFQAVEVAPDAMSFVPIIDDHVVCPACRYAYDIAPEVTDAVAECTNCHATFHIKIV